MPSPYRNWSGTRRNGQFPLGDGDDSPFQPCFAHQWKCKSQTGQNMKWAIIVAFLFGIDIHHWRGQDQLIISQAHKMAGIDVFSSWICLGHLQANYIGHDC